MLPIAEANPLVPSYKFPQPIIDSSPNSGILGIATERLLNNPLKRSQQTQSENIKRLRASKDQPESIIKSWFGILPFVSTPKILDEEDDDDKTELLSPDESMVSAGYGELSTFLEDKADYPWDQIRAVQHPVFIEQLCIIAVLLQQKGSNPSDLGRTFEISMAFVNQALLSMNSDESPFDVVGTKEIIQLLGEIIYLIDQNANELESKLFIEDLLHSSYVIEDMFKSLILKTQTSFQAYLDQHKQFNFQNIQEVQAALLPIKLAALLITSSGFVNRGIIRTLKEIFLDELNNTNSYVRHIKKKLDLIESSPTLRSKIHQILKPNDPDSMASRVIRITLGILNESPVTDNDAKIAGLSGILTLLRQGEVGSCFATSLAIQLLEDHPGRCLDDFSQLLRTDMLTRTVDGKTKMFPFLLKVSHSSSNKLIKLNLDGKIVNEDKKGFFIWESPGIQAALRAVGIYEFHFFLLRAIDNLRYKTKGGLPLKLTINQLLTETITFAFQHRFYIGTRLEALIEIGLIAYQAEVQNPLQSVWENSLAGMAESASSALLKKSHLDSVTSSIDDFLEHKSIAKRKQIIEIIERELNTRLEILFDPSIVHLDPKDQESDYGGFVAYDNCLSEDPNNWKRIDNLGDYKRFLFSMVTIARKRNKEQITSITNCQVFRKIELYTQSTVFLKKTLREYCTKNLSEMNLLEDISKLKHTPWVDKRGNIFTEVYRVYLEKNSKPDSVSLEVTNASDLLEQLLQEIRRLPRNESEAILKNPYYRTPGNINGRHAFTFIFGHSTIKKFIESNEDISTWINETILEPGLDLSNSTASALTRSKLISYSLDLLEAADKEPFRIASSSISQNISIKTFRNEILRRLIPKIQKKTDDDIKITLEFDTFLALDALPANQKNLLIQNRLHFADTNWIFSSVNSSHFCFVVNPGNGEIEVWETQENGEGIKPLNQKKWVNGKTWQIIKSLI